MKKLVIVLFVTVLVAQSSETQLSPVVTYWKTLSIDEKETFLFSYLTQVYETHTELKKSEGYGGITEWYYNNRAELVYIASIETSVKGEKVIFLFNGLF